MTISVFKETASYHSLLSPPASSIAFATAVLIPPEDAVAPVIESTAKLWFFKILGIKLSIAVCIISSVSPPILVTWILSMAFSLNVTLTSNGLE